MTAAVKQAWRVWAELFTRLGSSCLQSITGTSHSGGASWESSIDNRCDGYVPAASGMPDWHAADHSCGRLGEQAEADVVATGGLSYDLSSSSSQGLRGRQLQQMFQTQTAACSRQVPWRFGLDTPMLSVDWLRQGVVPAGVRDQGNCSNSFAFVAAALAESTMALLGYTGSASRLSEAQLMACVPGANCSRAGTTHVVLNSLACNGFAAADAGTGAFPLSDPEKATNKPNLCSAGDFSPVRTGIIGWSFVPPTELAFAQALSRTPIKVAVDATILQTYRAGFVGCNVKSSVANHAILAVGYSQRVRATQSPQAARSGQRSFAFVTGGEYWMLRNSWGTLGSVDGYVYVAKGCGSGNVAPLGLLANRGVMPMFNASSTYGVGRLQCYFPGDTPDPGCDKNLLMKLSSFCARVDDFLPLKARTNCSCSCLPV